MKLCHCQHPECNATIPAALANDSGWERVTLKNRGERAAYLCPMHAGNAGDVAFFVDNDATRGKQAANGCKVQVSLQVHNPSPTLRAELCNVDFLPTEDYDGRKTFKSPQYKSLRPLPKKFATVSAMLENGEAVVMPDDSAPVSVYHPCIDADAMEALAFYAPYIFTPFADYLLHNPEKSRALFGATYDGCKVVNLQSDSAITWTFAHFADASQYVAAVRFFRGATLAIINNFLAHYYDIPKAGSIADYRRHKARIAGGKLIKLLEK